MTVPPRERRLPDGGTHGNGWQDSGRQDSLQDSGLQERMTRPRMPEAAAAPVTQRPGHRRAAEEPPPGSPADDRQAARPETGRAASEAAGRATSVSGGRPAQAAGSKHGAPGRARPKRRGGRGRLLIAGGLVVAVVVGAAAYLELTGHHSTAPNAARLKPAPVSDPGPPASLGQWGYIGSRTTDPVPLSLGELFPSSFASGGLTYSMTVDKSRGSCNQGLVGTQIQSAAQQAGCTQAMSASYLSSDQKLMGTIGVLNLSTAAGSDTTGKAAGASETIGQLPGPSGPTAKLTQGTGLEAAEVKGHYLVLVWAEFANLQAPSTPAQKQQLQAFITLLIQKTANVSLASREVTGKPAS